MTIKSTRWSPDTCGCVFDYEWDDQEPQDTRTHTFKQVVTECASHSHLQGNNKKDMYDSSLEENLRKNFTFKELMEKASADFTETQPDGTIILKRNIIIDWTWSGTAPNRVLTINISGVVFSQQKKNQFQSFVDTRFGVGKVILTYG